DHGSDQGDIVRVFAGTGTDSAFPFGIGQVFVGFNLVGLDAVSGDKDVAGTDCQAIPDSIGISVLGRDVLFQGFGFNGLGNIGFDKFAQVANIHGQYDVGRAIEAFPLEALQN